MYKNVICNKSNMEEWNYVGAKFVYYGNQVCINQTRSSYIKMLLVSHMAGPNNKYTES